MTASVAANEKIAQSLACEKNTRERKRQTVLQLGGLLSQLLGGPGWQLAVLIEVSSDFIPPVKGEGGSESLFFACREKENRKQVNLPADGASREEVDSLGQQTVLGVGPCAFLGNFRDSVLW